MYKIFIFLSILRPCIEAEETQALSLQQRSEISARLDRLLSAKKLTSRRYAQFEFLFNSAFDNNRDTLLKFYSYGCYCLNLGDRPLTGILAGFKPTDLIDKTCFQWTKCNRCVLNDYGPTCLAEITKYSYKVDRRTGEITCLDPYFEAPADNPSWVEGYGPGEVPGCRRAVCECDKAQVNKLKKVKYSCKNDNLLITAYNETYHHFYGGWRFDKCEKVKPKCKERGGCDTGCCGEFPQRFPFDRNIRQCCNGDIKGLAYQCPTEDKDAGKFDDNIGRKRRESGATSRPPNRLVKENYKSADVEIATLAPDDGNVDYDLNSDFSSYDY
ncbi:Oidioi.mRNA.OKI2018_I69.PAR.g12784.t1.cds [Oikopleura dioica]|uniref:Oidioi.mRNA.OKI2018_I69.PAR.g12784.t1.cds n=1 Tax=Oikopleura dioica TaxID=34765 RepID=A0ABN7S6F6_OIKDI|nr:Oidioi.mRNA.OKI2018_I69.PAR.g12784.t1.cds [Oikopleura dioica]